MRRRRDDLLSRQPPSTLLSPPSAPTGPYGNALKLALVFHLGGRESWQLSLRASLANPSLQPLDDGQLLSTLHHARPTCSFHFNQPLFLRRPSDLTRSPVFPSRPLPEFRPLPLAKTFNRSISNRRETELSLSLIEFASKTDPDPFMPSRCVFRAASRNL